MEENVIKNRTFFLYVSLQGGGRAEGLLQGAEHELDQGTDCGGNQLLHVRADQGGAARCVWH